MTLPERLNKKDRNVWNAEKFSTDSRREFAEAVDREDWETALRVWFRSAADESIDEHLPPYRDVEGAVVNNAALDTNQRAVVEVSLDTITTTAYVDDESTYTHREIEDGDYSVSAEVTEVVEYDDETMESTTHNVTDYSLTLEGETMTVDTTQTAIGTVVGGPKITIDSITLEAQ